MNSNQGNKSHGTFVNSQPGLKTREIKAEFLFIEAYKFAGQSLLETSSK